MKVIKRGIYILTFIIALFIINVNVKAYDIYVSSVATYTEKEIYEYFSQIENFDINEHKNIYCSASGSYLYCNALTDKSVETLTYPSNVVTLTNYDNCNYYYLEIYKRTILPIKAENRSCSYNEGKLISIYTDTLSNFNFNFFSDSDNSKYNKLDFSSYLTPEEEKPELEITIKATNLLNFMLDKTKNIYEVLIDNQIFQFCLGILISYLIFIFLFRFIKKE